MRIALIVEGETEMAFLPHLRRFLETRLEGRMPKFDPLPFDGRIPTRDKLKRLVRNTLEDRKRPADAVIAITDVYTGSLPPEFEDAADAKVQMRNWVGDEPRFHPHVAQHDFEAWLLPYWRTIQKLAGSNRASPGSNPELVNHHNPPAARIKEVFRNGSRGRGYVKPRDADRILRGQDLFVSANHCPELKSFLNTVLHLCGGDVI
ncbi:MAG: DUF4276 family protein [Pirellulales bacterium]